MNHFYGVCLRYDVNVNIIINLTNYSNKMSQSLFTVTGAFAGVKPSMKATYTMKQNTMRTAPVMNSNIYQK
jgi:hypothetical protein